MTPAEGKPRSVLATGRHVQGQILDAGEGTEVLRNWLRAAVVFVFLVLVFLAPTGMEIIWYVCVLTALYYVVVAPLLVVVYRGVRSRRLRRRLAALPIRERAQALLPLAEERGDTGRIARGLIRSLPLLAELDRPAEVTPAPAPGGRGGEVTPARGRPGGPRIPDG